MEPWIQPTSAPWCRRVANRGQIPGFTTVCNLLARSTLPASEAIHHTTKGSGEEKNSSREGGHGGPPNRPRGDTSVPRTINKERVIKVTPKKEISLAGSGSETNTDKKATGKKKEIHVDSLTHEEALRLWEDLLDNLPQHSADLELMAKLLAEQNVSGKVAITKVWRQLGKRFVDYREKLELSDEAWAFGFDRAIAADAPNMGYVMQAAKGYSPTKHNNGGSGGRWNRKGMKGRSEHWEVEFD